MRPLAFLACLTLAFGPPLAAQSEPTPVEQIADDFACPVDDTAVIEPEPPVQDYEPSPAMWKIADEDTTIYLFGTFHVLPEGFRWRTPLLDKVIAETDEVVFESRDDDSERDNPLDDETLRFLRLMQEYRTETPLSQRLSPENLPKFTRLLELANIPMERADYAPPIMTMIGIAIRISQLEGSRRDLGVETIIEAEYKADERPISAIEDPIEVFKNVFNIDESALIEAIDESLKEWDGCEFFDAEDVDWTSEHSWAKGELDEINLDEMFDDPFGKAFYEVLLVDRNRAWGEWVKDRMARPGNLLLAVGAGHMEGPDSLVLMLEADGVTVERIQ